jgi:hypothetical protein
LHRIARNQDKRLMKTLLLKLLVGVATPLLAVPFLLLLASFLIPHHNIPPAEKSWLPLIKVLTVCVYSCIFTPILLLLNSRLLFKATLTFKDTLVQVSAPIVLLFILASLVFRFLPDQAIHGADIIWNMGSNENMTTGNQDWILIAKENLSAGTVLDVNNIYPALTNTTGSIVLLKDEGTLIGHQLMRNYKKGEPISWKDVR